MLIGAGHCARAIAKLARECGLHVSVVEDRAELLADFAEAHATFSQAAPEWIAARAWRRDEALVLVSRNFQIDQEALFAAVRQPGIGYIGMIGSRRKVRRVFDEMAVRGISGEILAKVHAPIGLDIGADSPAEIAVSVLAEIFAVLRGRSGAKLSLSP